MEINVDVTIDISMHSVNRFFCCVIVEYVCVCVLIHSNTHRHVECQQHGWWWWLVWWPASHGSSSPLHLHSPTPSSSPPPLSRKLQPRYLHSQSQAGVPLLPPPARVLPGDPLLHPAPPCPPTPPTLLTANPIHCLTENHHLASHSLGNPPPTPPPPPQAVSISSSQWQQHRWGVQSGWTTTAATVPFTSIYRQWISNYKRCGGKKL